MQRHKSLIKIKNIYNLKLYFTVLQHTIYQYYFPGFRSFHIIDLVLNELLSEI